MRRDAEGYHHQHKIDEYKQQMYKLTSLVGDPVGASVGLDEGEADGPFEGDAEGILLGAFEDDWLGL